MIHFVILTLFENVFTEFKNSTIIKTSEYKIKPFKKIRIGDPMYFDRIADGEKAKMYQNLVCDIKTTCCKVGMVRIEESSVKADFGEYNQIDVDVFLASNDEQLDVYKDGCWFGEESLKHRYTLGCDTASYEIEVDGRYEKVYTGADGYYGELKQMKQYYGLMLSLSFDADLFSFEEIEKLMDYLFVFEK